MKRRPNTTWRNKWDLTHATIVDVVSHKLYPIVVAISHPVEFTTDVDPLGPRNASMVYVACGPAADLPERV